MIQLHFNAPLRYGKTGNRNVQLVFGTLLKNELNSNFARFYHPGVEPVLQQIRLLQLVVAENREQFYLLQQNLYILRVFQSLVPRVLYFLRRVRTLERSFNRGKSFWNYVMQISCMKWLPRRFVQSKVNIHATFNNLYFARQVWTRVVERTTKLLNSFRSNAAK